MLIVSRVAYRAQGAQNHEGETMTMDALTRDNPHLSRPTNSPPDDADSPPSDGRTPVAIGDLCAITCMTQTPNQVPDRVAALVEASIAENTRRAYRSDLAHFAAWGGQLPADPSAVASYLAANVETLSVATLVRRMATISKAHEARGMLNPAGRKSSGLRCAA